MRIRRLWLTVVLLAVSNFQISAQTTATPASDELKAAANNVSVSVPEPQAAKVSAPQSAARADWFNAVQLYHDNVFSPRPQRRVDVAGSPVVMLQGFHWYADSYWLHPPKGWWGVLAQNAADVGRSGFDLVWFPPVSNGSYYPTEWYNLESQWGKKDVLVEAVNAMHSAGVKVVADVILNHRNGTTNWLDFTNPIWASTVIVQNDEVWGQPAYAHLQRSPNYDEGQNDIGCRDIDHKDMKVREDTKIFMRWLRNTIGFDGWRYDMVKGYAPYHIQDYNTASSPVFSVGEYYDANRQLIADWIDGTDNSSGKVNASSAFDFATRFSLIAAVEGDRYELLNDNNTPSGLIGWWPSKSVTFVENHDTSPRDPNFLQNASKQYRDQRLLGYAYILTHPGIPCVFWPHYYDWGARYKNQIQALISARKSAGITSTSEVRILTATNGLYAAVITGAKQWVALKMGSNMSWQPGPGWTLVTSGEKYAVWTQNRK